VGQLWDTVNTRCFLRERIYWMILLPELDHVNPSVACGLLCVCRLSVTFVRPTQPVEIFGCVSTPFCTLAIR